jgi:hypothetical protein
MARRSVGMCENAAAFDAIATIVKNRAPLLALLSASRRNRQPSSLGSARPLPYELFVAVRRVRFAANSRVSRRAAELANGLRRRVGAQV